MAIDENALQNQLNAFAQAVDQRLLTETQDRLAQLQQMQSILDRILIINDTFNSRYGYLGAEDSPVPPTGDFVHSKLTLVDQDGTEHIFNPALNGDVLVNFISELPEFQDPLHTTVITSLGFLVTGGEVQVTVNWLQTDTGATGVIQTPIPFPTLNQSMLINSVIQANKSGTTVTLEQTNTIYNPVTDTQSQVTNSVNIDVPDEITEPYVQSSVLTSNSVANGTGTALTITDTVNTKVPSTGVTGSSTSSVTIQIPGQINQELIITSDFVKGLLGTPQIQNNQVKYNPFTGLTYNYTENLPFPIEDNVLIDFDVTQTGLNVLINATFLDPTTGLQNLKQFTLTLPDVGDVQLPSLWVVQNVTQQLNGSNQTVMSVTMYNLQTGATNTVNTLLIEATDTNNGLMPASAMQNLESLNTSVQGLLQGVQIVFSSTPVASATDANNAWVAGTAMNPVAGNTIIDINGALWRYVTTGPNVTQWIQAGTQTLPPFGTNSMGIITAKGNPVPGDVVPEGTIPGAGAVYGWAAQATAVSNNTSAISALTTRVTTNETNINTNTTDIATANTNISNNSASITALQSRVTTNETNIQNNTDAIGTLSASLLSNWNDQNDLRNKVDIIETTVSYHTSVLADIPNQLENMMNTITSQILPKIDTLEEAIADVQTQVTSNTQRTERLEGIVGRIPDTYNINFYESGPSFDQSGMVLTVSNPGNGLYDLNDTSYSVGNTLPQLMWVIYDEPTPGTESINIVNNNITWPTQQELEGTITLAISGVYQNALPFPVNPGDVTIHFALLLDDNSISNEITWAPADGNLKTITGIFDIPTGREIQGVQLQYEATGLGMQVGRFFIGSITARNESTFEGTLINNIIDLNNKIGSGSNIDTRLSNVEAILPIKAEAGCWQRIYPSTTLTNGQTVEIYNPQNLTPKIGDAIIDSGNEYPLVPASFAQITAVVDNTHVTVGYVFPIITNTGGGGNVFFTSNTLVNTAPYTATTSYNTQNLIPKAGDVFISITDGGAAYVTGTGTVNSAPVGNGFRLIPIIPTWTQHSSSSQAASASSTDPSNLHYW